MARSGLAKLTLPTLIMLLISCVLIYLAISRSFEPLILLPLGFGGILANIPGSEIALEGGLLFFIQEIGIDTGVFPLLIFMGVGAMTDFGPMLANPRTLFLGAAAQVGIFITVIGAILLNKTGLTSFTLQDAAAIGIIGGADGPTAIYVSSMLAPQLIGAVKWLTLIWL